MELAAEAQLMRPTLFQEVVTEKQNVRPDVVSLKRKNRQRK